MNQKRYDNNVTVIPIVTSKPTYSKSSILLSTISKQEVEIGKLKSYIDELEYENAKLKKIKDEK